MSQTNNARLDQIVKAKTAFATFQELLDAPAYRPSLDMKDDELFELARAYEIPTLTNADDPRLHFLARCMVGGAQPVIRAMLLLNVCGDAMQAAIDQMPGNTDVRMATIDKLQACLDAIQELGATGANDEG